MNLLCKIPVVKSCVEIDIVIFQDRFCSFVLSNTTFLLHSFIFVLILVYIHCLKVFHHTSLTLSLLMFPHVLFSDREIESTKQNRREHIAVRIAKEVTYV